MISGLIGKKLGMTQIFSAQMAKLFPSPFCRSDPVLSLRSRQKNKDGYSSVQLGFVEPIVNQTITENRCWVILRKPMFLRYAK